VIIKNVKLLNVRNFNELDINLSRGINIFYGANAQGKTNFLESVYFCATGRSQRANSDKDLIKFGENEAHIQITVEREKKYTDRIDAHIKKETGKGIAVNGIAIKKLSELFGVLFAVIFTPEDLSLVKAGPSERRRFVDIELCQMSAVYYYEIQQYYKILKQRNSLLKNIQKNKELKETIFVWDEQLCNHGIKIIRHRSDFIHKINIISGKIHNEITDGTEALETIYKPNVTEEDFRDRLKKGLDRDIMLGSTQTGIHKDEISFLINGRDSRSFGSQGQQRTASLSTKLAEISFIHQEKRQNPVLLLDDVFSELDSRRQAQLVERITGVQTILTCTGVEDVLSRFSGRGEVCCYNVDNGEIMK